MGLEGGKKLRKTMNAAALSALMATVQPPTHLDQQPTKPAGVRESLRKLDESKKRMTLPDGRQVQIADNDPPAKKPRPDAIEDGIDL